MKKYIVRLHKAGEPDGNGFVHTVSALRDMAAQKPGQLEFDETSQILWGTLAAKSIRWHWEPQRVWYKPWTWRHEPIKLVDEGAMLSASFEQPDKGVKP